MEIEIKKERRFNMKQMLFLSLFLSFIIMGTSCQKDDYLQYDSNYASLRFVYSASGNDSIVYSFALHPDVEEGLVEVPFKLIGLATPANRVVNVEVVNTGTTAKENDNFIIENCELPADAIEGNLKVRVKKTDNLNTQNLSLVVRLCENNYFSTAPIDEDTYRIVLTNQLIKPTGWPFGEYSSVKHQFVIKVTGIATDYNKWNNSDRIYYTGILVKALYEYNKEHPGEPLKDENGLLVTF